MQPICPTELKRKRRLVAIHDVAELNRAALELGRRIALIDTSVCARLFRIPVEEANALANMPDIALEHIADAGLSVFVMESERRHERLPADSSEELLDLERQLEGVFDAVYAAAHRYALESSNICETYFHMREDEVNRLSSLTELGRRGKPATWSLRIFGLVPMVELINRERGMPEYVARLESSLLALRLCTLPI